MRHQDPMQFDKVATPVVIGIATTGRPAIVRQTLIHLAGLRDRPDRVCVAIGSSGDLDLADLPDLPFPFEVLRSELGACVQRNALFRDADRDVVLLFIDDDYLLADGFVSACRSLFDTAPDVVVATGHVIADGIGGPGFDHAQGLRLLEADAGAPDVPQVSAVYNGYGCNMAVRAATALDHGLRFDTALPRYGWLEDIDLSRRLARYGRVVRSDAMRGVHLGTKTGRSRGVRLGYSQIANPLYLVGKGSMSRSRAFNIMGRNMLANLAKSVRPEPWVDRRGRLRGNLRALRDLVTGRIRPDRILDL
ncbi:glycosyltransferase family 2 protein [Oceanicola sp. 22II-s10i]|uniref:glycosyltransferase family 2 protein n=1 Tax=Oceanicola sp. 22II-s10i TaxID=1317116 RepID=UPI001131C37D|nr:glycosyltransferase family 2 protein [Oceanicola sp. 22II-s10i]